MQGQLRSFLALTVIVIVVSAIAVIGAARAQDHHAPFHEEFYRKWKQPGSDASCCNARKTVHGHEVGDCEPAPAEIRNGDWYAWNRLQGRWIRIPDGRILRERNPTRGGVDGHLCWTEAAGVLCFVPPDTAM